MLVYVVRRVLTLVPLLAVISLLTFFLIQLPPGNYVEIYRFNMMQAGLPVDAAEIGRMTQMYALDKPVYYQYAKWVSGFATGNLGRSMITERPTKDVLLARVPISMAISILTIVFVWITAVPIGIYSATHQYSVVDSVLTAVSFIGLGLPNFLFALVLIWTIYSLTGHAMTGLFSLEYVDAPWGWAKIVDLLKNIWVPLVILGMSGTAGLIRVTRGNLLDELRKPYVTTARAKGLRESTLLWRYPIRVAFNPVISTIGWMLPGLVGGEVIVSTVLNIKTVGPLLTQAVLAQDMYFAGSILMILSTLSVIGTLLSDLALAWLDPRIRFEGQR